MSRRRRHRRLIVFSDQYNCRPAAPDQPPVGNSTGAESERCYTLTGEGRAVGGVARPGDNGGAANTRT
ncbi:conserved hypothetical protein [Streptomyces sviceus ATCC 29083]|uniref:Uncharacterized protein n=1 Tax=Streptomyces sviceus (strain ATCC 29083 / DSM 924 / JCM 4929 / NBRC 13980 / NCIMB 11184 / NRRL 5439 / UC 5370) TaxID=463191 RepID=B5HNC3_STRX2|nr:conserved hypothetical protein [Streptomyces sviceus ATCC 29083]